MTTADADIRMPPAPLPWWSPLASWLETIVAFLPSHPSTNRGRQTARRIKIVLGAIGGATIVFGPAAGWTAFGIAMLLAMLLLPVPEVTKRRWRGTLDRVKSGERRTDRRSGTLTLDDARLTLESDDNTLLNLALDARTQLLSGIHDDRRHLHVDSPDLSTALLISARADKTSSIDVDHLSEPPLDSTIEARLRADDWNQFASELVHTIDSVE